MDENIEWVFMETSFGGEEKEGFWEEEKEGFWEEALEGPKRFEKLCRDFGEKIWRGVLRKWKEWGKLMKNRGEIWYH